MGSQCLAHSRCSLNASRMDGGLNNDFKIAAISRGRSRKLGTNMKNSTVQNLTTETGSGRTRVIREGLISRYLRKRLGGKK